MLKYARRNFQKMFDEAKRTDFDMNYKTKNGSQDMIVEINIGFSIPERNFCEMNDGLNEIKNIIKKLTNGDIYGLSEE